MDACEHVEREDVSLGSRAVATGGDPPSVSVSSSELLASSVPSTSAGSDNASAVENIK